MADFYDIDSTMQLNALGDIAVLSDGDAIRQSIRSIIISVTGFRPGVGVANEKYGVNINKYQFAPLTQFTAQSLSEAINRQLTIFEPRITLQNVHVNSNTIEKTFEIEVTYSIEGSTEKLTFRTVINQL